MGKMNRARETVGPLTAAPPISQFPFPNSLVVQTAFLGDVILTTGLLTELAARHGPVDVLVTPNASPLLETHPAVGNVLIYDKRGRDRGMAAFRRLAGELEQRRYARVYLPHRSPRSAVLAWLAGIPERIGFADASCAFLYTRRVARPTIGHEAERLLALAGPAPGAKAKLKVELLEDDRAQAYAWLAARGIGDGFVALAPGSVWATKRWVGYPDLARQVKGRVVVIGGPDEIDEARAIVEAAPDRVASAAGELPLRVSAALLERAAVLVTNDSAPLHLASAVGTPTVAIFGPTVPRFGFGPRAPRAAIVERTDLACRPCSAHGPEICPLGHHRCMREIPAATVRDVIQQLIG
jgi:heptosyltransferase-2